MVDFSRSAAVLRMLLPNLSIVCPVYHREVRSCLTFLQESTSEGVLASPVPQRWDRMHMLSVSPPPQETSLPSRKVNIHHRHMCLKPSPQGVGLLGKVIEHLGGGAWLKKVGHWGRILRLCSLTPVPGCSQVDRQCDRLPHTPAALASPTHSETVLLFLP